MNQTLNTPNIDVKFTQTNNKTIKTGNKHSFIKKNKQTAFGHISKFNFNET